jgi:hypothetical protein
MKKAIAALSVLSMIVVAPGLLAALSAPAREVCVAKHPQMASQRIGFELIDLMRRQAWVTTNWTLDAYAHFSPPYTALNWVKNEPRVGFASNASVLRSPGCEQDGQFTFMNRFDRTFFHIADVTHAGGRHGPNGEISEVAVHKYHRLEFDAGQIVSILVAPNGDRFIGVNRPVGEAKVSPGLPEGWERLDRELEGSRRVDLFGDIRVLRLQNGASYQGPIGADW